MNGWVGEAAVQRPSRQSRSALGQNFVEDLASFPGPDIPCDTENQQIGLNADIFRNSVLGGL